MPFFTGDELLDYEPETTENVHEQNSKNRDTAEPLSQAARDEIMRVASPLFDAIRHRIGQLEQACNDSLMQTGFDFGEVDDALPHMPISDSLLRIYPLIDEAESQIQRGGFDAILTSLKMLASYANRNFTFVEEFLDGELSRMTKEQWKKLYPNWHKSRVIPVLDDESYWEIGDFVKPSKWHLLRRQELERKSEK